MLQVHLEGALVPVRLQRLGKEAAQPLDTINQAGHLWKSNESFQGHEEFLSHTVRLGGALNLGPLSIGDDESVLWDATVFWTNLPFTFFFQSTINHSLIELEALNTSALRTNRRFFFSCKLGYAVVKTVS